MIDVKKWQFRIFSLEFIFVSGEQDNKHVQNRVICDLIEVLTPLWSTNFYRVHDAQNISKAKL